MKKFLIILCLLFVPVVSSAAILTTPWERNTTTNQIWPYPTPYQKVGIGTTSPYAPLSVVGQTVSSYFTGTSTTATSSLYRLEIPGGGFKLGNETVAKLLIVGDGSYVTPVFLESLPASAGLLQIANGGTGSRYPDDYADFGIMYLNNDHGSRFFKATTTFSYDGAYFTQTDRDDPDGDYLAKWQSRLLDPFLVLFDNGNVGIATDTPSSLLSIHGSGGLYNGGNFFNAGRIISTSTSASIIPYASTTAISARTASTTNLIVSSAGGTAGCATFNAIGTISNTGVACGTGSGGSGLQVPSWIVAPSGGNFTTIQAALDACGVAGGGDIRVLTNYTFLGGTGLTFKGSKCNLIGAGMGTTTIEISGATTAIKTNSAAGLYAYNSVQNMTIVGDGNTSSVAIDMSDMVNNIYKNIVIDNVGTAIKANDTQNITFYNAIEKVKATTLTAFGINASSTNPVNANRFVDVFLGCSANCTGIQMNNGNNNFFESVRVEPASVTGTVGIKLFDNLLATNDGVFDNIFSNSYIEGNGTGISVAASVNTGGGGIQRNLFTGGIVDANTTDLSIADPTKNTFINVDNNFGNPINSFQPPFGIGTTTPFGIFSINPTSSLGNIPSLVIGSSSATKFIVDSAGSVGIGTSTPSSCTSNSIAGILCIDNPSLGRIYLSASTTAPVNAFFDARADTPNTSRFQLGTKSFHPVSFFTQDLRRMSLTTNGGIGLGINYADTTLYNPNAGTIITENALGVGTTSPPNGTLRVHGSAGMYNGGDFFNAGRIISTSTASSIFPYASTTALTSTGAAYFATTGGNVGVGTTTPSFPFTVTSGTVPQLALSNGVGVPLWTARNAGGNLYLSTTTVQGTATSSPAITINGSNGRVGINTSAPGSPFNVYTADGSGIAFQMTGKSRTGGVDADGVVLVYSFGGFGDTNQQFSLCGKNSGQCLRFLGYTIDGYNYLSDTRQDMALGTDTSDITVGRNITIANRMTTVHASTTGSLSVAEGVALSTGAGNTGVGTTTPWRKLSVSGTGAWTGLTAAAATRNSVCIDGTTKELQENAASSCLVSSKRYKHNIETLKESATEVILKLRPVTFEYNEGNVKGMGFVAEEVADVDPLFAEYNEKGQPQSLSISAILSYTVKAVQELIAKVTGLEDRLDEQEAKIKLLEEKLNNI